MPRRPNPAVPIVTSIGTVFGPPGPAGPPGAQGATGASGNTGGVSDFLEVMIAAGDFSTSSSTFKRVGGRLIDLTPYPANIGTLNRTVQFKASLESSTSSVITQVRLYDVTHGVVVLGTLLDNSSAPDVTLPYEVSFAPVVGSASGNLRSDVASQYEVQIAMSGGSPTSDRAICVDARLVITYS